MRPGPIGQFENRDRQQASEVAHGRAASRSPLCLHCVRGFLLNECGCVASWRGRVVRCGTLSTLCVIRSTAGPM